MQMRSIAPALAAKRKQKRSKHSWAFCCFWSGLQMLNKTGKSKGETHSGSFIPLLPDAMSPTTRTIANPHMHGRNVFCRHAGRTSQSTRLKRLVGVRGEMKGWAWKRCVWREEKARNKVQWNYRYNTGINNSWIISISILQWRTLRAFCSFSEVREMLWTKK